MYEYDVFIIKRCGSLVQNPYESWFKVKNFIFENASSMAITTAKGRPGVWHLRNFNRIEAPGGRHPKAIKTKHPTAGRLDFGYGRTLSSRGPDLRGLLFNITRMLVYNIENLDERLELPAFSKNYSFCIHIHFFKTFLASSRYINLFLYRVLNFFPN